MRFTTKKGYGVWQVVDAENTEWYCVRKTKRLADTLAERLNECCDDRDAVEHYTEQAAKYWGWKFPNKKGGGRPKGQDTAETSPPSNVPEFVEIDGDQPFGPQAKQIRLASGAGRVWVAEKSGVKLGTISHWEQNTGSYARIPGTDTHLLTTYLRALGVGRVVISINLSAISNKIVADWVIANESQIRLEHVMDDVECIFDAFPDHDRDMLIRVLNETIDL